MNSQSPMPPLHNEPVQSVGATTSDDQCETLLLRRPIALAPSSQFCMNPQLQTHAYDYLPSAPQVPTRRIQLLPRNQPADNPVIAELINTVAQANLRKRQREDAMFPLRDVGQQTGSDEEVDVETVEPRISDSKRFCNLNPSPPRDEITTESVGVNTSPPPTVLTEVTFNEPETSTEQPSTSSTAESRRAARIRERESPTARQQRRARRNFRNQQDALRMQLENNYLQQVTGLVPNDHSCDTRCPHYQHIALMNQVLAHQIAAPPPPPTGPNAVSPTVAPGAMLGRHPLATPFSYYHNYAPQMMMVFAPVPAPAPVQIPAPCPPPVAPPPMVIRPTPNPPGTLPPILQHQAMFSQAYNELYHLRYGGFSENITEMLRATNNQYLFPAAERFGLDRHHMFAGLDIDMPIGASKVEIDQNTAEELYEKKENDEEEEDVCTVCLSNYEPGESLRKLPCNHVFHPDCIYKWLDINKKCPMCREDIDSKVRPTTTTAAATASVN